MKMYNKKEFLKLPHNTLFMFGPGKEYGLEIGSSSLNIKYQSTDSDFVYKSLVDLEADGTVEIMEIHERMIRSVNLVGVSNGYPMDLDATTGEGFYDDDSLYIVFDKAEVANIIVSLQTLL